ncbi:hypothetical protein B296_00035240, partial [Ensete ventricosum]
MRGKPGPHRLRPASHNGPTCRIHLRPKSSLKTDSSTRPDRITAGKFKGTGDEWGPR